MITNSSSPKIAPSWKWNQIFIKCSSFRYAFLYVSKNGFFRVCKEGAGLKNISAVISKYVDLVLLLTQNWRVDENKNSILYVYMPIYTLWYTVRTNSFLQSLSRHKKTDVQSNTGNVRSKIALESCWVDWNESRGCQDVCGYVGHGACPKNHHLVRLKTRNRQV